MKISSKVRNGLVAMIYIAKDYDKSEKVTLLTISTNLGISKIYLEQAFLLLKRDGLVTSTKGPKGGYTLSRSPKEITAYDIISALDNSLFEKTESTVENYSKGLEKTMQTSIFDVLDKSVKDCLTAITLEQIVIDFEKNETNGNDYMYYL